MVAVETVAGVARQTAAHSTAATAAAGVTRGISSSSFGDHLGSEAIVAATTTSVYRHHSFTLTALD